MCDKLEERKKAMHMYHVEQLSKVEICRSLKRTRPWLDRWLGRYDPSNVEASLSDQKRGLQVSRRWSTEIHHRVLEMRKTRSQNPKWRYAFKGAKAIHLELKALGSIEAPPERTIHSWFVKANLIEYKVKQVEKREPKPIPIPNADTVNEVQQLDLKGPVYLEGSNTKYYIAVLRDRHSHRCALRVLKSRGAQGIVDFLVASWHWIGLPKYLQMDNALEFRGSNLYPRSFGKIIRVALDLDVEPLFNPSHEPWRNGGVEWFNSFINQRLLKVKFDDLDAFQKETQFCQKQCNQTHRLANHEGSTPNDMADKATLRFPPKGYKKHLAVKLPQDHGFISFVRLIRKSGRITIGAGDRFMVDPDRPYEYVLARVDLAQKRVFISLDGKPIRDCDFSVDTVGMWADDSDQLTNLDNEIVNVQ